MKNFLIFSGVVLMYTIMQTMAQTVPQSINYQGRVLVNGDSFSDVGYFRFAIIDETEFILWSNDGGSPPTTNISVTVVDSLFNITLGQDMDPIPESIFNQDELYLRIWFGETQETMQILSPDHQILTHGYAFKAGNAGQLEEHDGSYYLDWDNFHNVPSEIADGLDDDEPDDDSEVPDAISIDNGGLYSEAGSSNVGIGTTSPGCPLEVRADSGTAVRAYASGETGYISGVDAYTASPSGYALYGFNEAESGNAYAVFGENISPNGIAVCGVAENSNVESRCIGVYGKAGGKNESAGVYGEATSASGDNRGVWGHTGNPGGYAGYFTGGRNYFEGNVGIGVADPVEKLQVDGDIFLNPEGGIVFADERTRLSESFGTLYLRSTNSIFILPNNDVFIDESTLFVDGSLNRVGIGTSSPDAKLDVRGDILTNGDFTYSSDRTHHYQIPVAAFQYLNHTLNGSVGLSGFSGYVKTGSAPYLASFFAPVNLPDGATITVLKVFYLDKDPDWNMDLDVYLLEKPLMSVVTSGKATIEVSTSGSSTNIQSASDNSINGTAIANDQYQYIICVNLWPESIGTFLSFYGCEIEYTINTINPS